MHKPTAARSKHFTLHPLGAGTFAAIAENGGWAICNSSLLDLGGQVVVFDAFMSPQAAQDLRAAAIELLGRAPQLLINSHYHNDHIWGSQIFAADAQILSSTRTRDLITTKSVQELEWFAENAVQQLASYRQDYQEAQDEQERSQALLLVGQYEGLVEALPYLKVCQPGITFEHRLEIHGRKRSAELITYEGGHTASDTLLYLPEDGIVFMGDLLFVGFHPYLAECSPHVLLQVLEELSRLDAQYFIPGHGAVGRVADLRLLIEYVEHCLETAETQIARGETGAEQIAALPIPDRYQYWQFPMFYASNISSLCERLRLDDQG